MTLLRVYGVWVAVSYDPPKTEAWYAPECQLRTCMAVCEKNWGGGGDIARIRVRVLCCYCCCLTPFTASPSTPPPNLELAGEERYTLTWDRRMRVLRDTANGMLFLHSNIPPVLHRMAGLLSRVLGRVMRKYLDHHLPPSPLLSSSGSNPPSAACRRPQVAQLAD